MVCGGGCRGGCIDRVSLHLASLLHGVWMEHSMVHGDWNNCLYRLQVLVVVLMRAALPKTVDHYQR